MDLGGSVITNNGDSFGIRLESITVNRAAFDRTRGVGTSFPYIRVVQPQEATNPKHCE